MERNSTAERRCLPHRSPNCSTQLVETERSGHATLNGIQFGPKVPQDVNDDGAKGTALKFN
jgi:hypothetical protein